MQPFGLWNFLQLALTPPQQEKTPDVQEKSRDDEAESTSPVPEEEPPFVNAHGAAYQNFIERHEQAAKRFRQGK